MAELDGCRKVIEGARQILANYKPTIRIDPEWPRVKLGKICRIDAPLIDPKLPQFWSLPHVSGENIESGTGGLLTLHSAAEDKVISGKYAFKAGAVLYSKLRPYLCKAALAAFDGLCSADMYPLIGAYEVIEKRVVTIGLLDKSQVHPREVFADVIADRAAAVILAHNHPSGNPEPSDADHRIHEQLSEAANILGLRVLDHVIVTKKGHFSFQESGLIRASKWI